MAIVKAHRNLQVQVVANGAPLEEHDDDEVAAPNTVIKYIESQSGIEFAVKSKLSKPWPGCTLMFLHYIDGKRIGGNFIMQKDHFGEAVESSMMGRRYSVNGNWFLEAFCFSDLKIEATGAPAITDQLMKDLKEVGEIKLEVFRVKNLRPTRDSAGADTPGGVGDVPEKALKGRALSHQSSYRPAAATVVHNSMTPEYMDGMDKPMAVFIFKYRSRTALQSLLIIPRTPSPVPLEERELATLSQEESLELIRRMREREQSAVVVKRERIKREDSKREWSRERSSTVGSREEGEIVVRSSKRRRLPITIDANGVETIDLT